MCFDADLLRIGRICRFRFLIDRTGLAFRAVVASPLGEPVLTASAVIVVIQYNDG